MAEKNLVVEGVDDYWILMAISGVFERSGLQSLDPEVLITAAGGASEVTYIATFMVGQELDVVALYDTDQAGDAAKDKFVKNWLARYKVNKASALSLGPAVGVSGKEFEIEDLFPEGTYLKYVEEQYGPQLLAARAKPISLSGGGAILKRLERFFESHGISFNKGSIAKRICADIRKMKDTSELPGDCAKYASALFGNVSRAFSKGEK